jgi:hypothetical protein
MTLERYNDKFMIEVRERPAGPAPDIQWSVWRQGPDAGHLYTDVVVVATGQGCKSLDEARRCALAVARTLSTDLAERDEDRDSAIQIMLDTVSGCPIESVLHDVIYEAWRRERSAQSLVYAAEVVRDDGYYVLQSVGFASRDALLASPTLGRDEPHQVRWVPLVVSAEHYKEVLVAGLARYRDEGEKT